MDFQLTGRCAMVTGASGALGAAIARAFADEGMYVLGAGRDRNRLAALEEFHPDRIATVCCDVTDREALAGLPAGAHRRFGRLDVVVNNAGIQTRGAFEEQPQRDWDEHIAVNLTAAVVLTRAAAPMLLGQGSGKVINIASTAGVKGASPGMTAYSATKGALIALTRSLAVEWAPRGVQVNAIAPGAFDSTMQPESLRLPGPALTERVSRIPDGRMGVPAELGPIACLLASPVSAHVTGAVYLVDGGESVRL
jgi:2-deoxy-D-gluconate 3-dehydrogenase